MELPPRARRILSNPTPQTRNMGTTSACAENTWPVRGCSHSLRNYLRVRGEYSNPSQRGFDHEELPPRARRIQVAAGGPNNQLGTTSACAENTFQIVIHDTEAGNYLRVRGEYQKPCSPPMALWELPPRARRIQVAAGGPNNQLGTTSACAENTFQIVIHDTEAGNYLRVRGEYQKPCSPPMALWELPPRARRIRRKTFLIISSGGTTSACAENTRKLRIH